MRMRTCALAGLGGAFQLLSSTQAYLTTIEISLSYCPAPSLALASETDNASPTPGPSESYLLYVQSGTSGLAQYLTATGAVDPDVQDAQAFTISPGGQLLSGGSYFSTSGLVPFEPFAIRAFVPRSISGVISTTFSNQNGILAWTSASFALGQAQFCLMGTTLEVAYDGYLPASCIAVNINLELTSAVMSTISLQPTPTSSLDSMAISSTPTPPPSAPGSVHGHFAVGDPVGCLMSASTAPALAGISETTSTLEQCVDYCAAYSYFGVSNGSQCVCGDTLGTSAGPASYDSCSLQCSGNSTEICGGETAMELYTIVSRTGTGFSSSSSVTVSSTATISLFPSPTSTGVPNCYDRSPFDGTVNGGYLILCNTDLPGYDLVQQDGNDLAECISQCNSFVPSGAGYCVAVEYDVQAIYNACTLKSKIGVIDRGDNQYAQAAVLMNEPYSPVIQFADQMPPSSVLSNTIATSSIAAWSVPVGAPSSSALAPSSTPVLRSSSPSNSAGVASSAVQPSSSLEATSSPSTSTAGTSAIPSSSTSSATGCLAQPTGTLCPTYNGQTVSQGGFCYDIECTAALQGNILTGNSSTANSLSNCIGFCNLYNLALPYGCVGVNYLNTGQPQPNCLLLSSITGLVYNPGTNSGSLIYAGYVSRAISGAPTTSSPSSSIASSTQASSTVGTSLSSSLSSSVSTTSSVVSSSSSSISSSRSSSSPLPLLSLSISSTSSSFLSASRTISSSSTSTSVSTTCATSYAPGPAMGSLCTNPSYDHQAVSYDSYGTTENYEIECGTVFTGTSLAASVAFDLPDCIKACQYDNQYTAASCKAIMFNNTVAARPPINNCFPFASVTDLTRGSTIFDGARLLYAGYPCIAD